MVHTAVLIDLRTPQSGGLAYWPQAKEFKGPVDDVVYFAYSAKKGGKRGVETASLVPA